MFEEGRPYFWMFEDPEFLVISGFFAKMSDKDIVLS
jgi:hypothetical protein